jgi:hypothetical protein
LNPVHRVSDNWLQLLAPACAGQEGIPCGHQCGARVRTTGLDPTAGWVIVAHSYHLVTDIWIFRLAGLHASSDCKPARAVHRVVYVLLAMRCGVRNMMHVARP